MSEIGPIRPVGNPERRDSASLSYRRFVEEYFPHTFTEFTQRHMRMVAAIEKAADGAKQVAMAAVGDGKTSNAIAGAVFAALCKGRKRILIVCASRASSIMVMSHVKSELTCNDRLDEDFPEVCQPIRTMDGMAQRCASQTSLGVRTAMQWRACQITLPTIAGSPASGATISSASILGPLIGLRPDMVIFDDLETCLSANSHSGTRHRRDLYFRFLHSLRPGTGCVMLGHHFGTSLLPDWYVPEVE